MEARAGRLGGIAVGVFALLALASIVIASSAAAQAPARSRRRQTVIPAGSWSGFDLRGSNGFDVDVSTAGRQHVALEVLSRADNVTYVAPATVTRDRIEAKFGGIGEIQMRFKPLGPPQRTKEPQGHCRGPKALDQKGVFVGRFSFRGEGGFTTVAARRVKGLRVESFREVCEGGGRNGFAETEPIKPDLTAKATEGGREISVELRLREYELSTWATVREERAGMQIERFIGLAGKRDLYAEQKNGSALVSPPPPFTGEAEYRPAALGGAPWTGTLAAPFPGIGVVRLAGPGFTVSR